MRTRELERWLIARTELIVAARLMKQRGLQIMPLELKGLKGQSLQAAGHIERLNRAYAAFNTAAPAHAADVEGLVPQIEGLSEDLAFAAQVLGNSAAADSTPLPPPPSVLNGQAGVGDLNQPKTAPEPSVARASPPPNDVRVIR